MDRQTSVESQCHRLSWVQTRPYSYTTSGLNSGSSSVQQSKGEYRVLSKSNLTLRNGKIVYAYGYIKDKAWFYLHKAIFLTHAGFYFINTFAKDIYFPYIRVILKRGFVIILSAAEHSVPTTHGRQPFVSKIKHTLMFSLIPTHLVVETKP